MAIYNNKKKWLRDLIKYSRLSIYLKKIKETLTIRVLLQLFQYKTGINLKFKQKRSVGMVWHISGIKLVGYYMLLNMATTATGSICKVFI